MPTKHALLIGVSEYENDQLTTLQYTVKDMRDLADVLTGHVGFVRQNVHLMTSDVDKGSPDYPRQVNVLERLRKYAKGTKSASSIHNYSSSE